MAEWGNRNRARSAPDVARPPPPPALGHTMLVSMYHMLKEGVDYQELGPDYLDKLQPLRLTTYLVKRLESLGHKVTLAQADQAA